MKTNLYYIIKQNGKTIECYDMSQAGPCFRAMSKEITKKHLKKGQTFVESTKAPRIRKAKNVVAQAMTLGVNTQTVVAKVGY